MVVIICLVIGYLLGSLSTAIIVAKLTNQPDPRTQGSGNAGATNVLRSSGKQMAALVLAGDAGKGFVATCIAWLLGLHGFALGLVALAAVAGHIFPVFFKFKGGKGVATAMGCLIVLSLWTAVISIIVWIAITYITRYASLASILTLVIAWVLLLFSGHGSYLIPMLGVVILIIWKHWENIQRLRNGTESKVQF